MSRKLTDNEKARRAVTRENNRRKKEAPLLVQAGALPVTNEAEQRERLQGAAAMAAENCGVISGGHVLESLTERWLARMVSKLVSPEDLARMEEYTRRTYPSVSYWSGFWQRVLTGHRVVVAWRLEETKRRTIRLENGKDLSLPAGRLIEDGVLQLEPPPFTQEQLRELLPLRSVNAPAHQPDDGGLWASVQAAIDRAAANGVRVVDDTPGEPAGLH